MNVKSCAKCMTTEQTLYQTQWIEVRRHGQGNLLKFKPSIGMGKKGDSSDSVFVCFRTWRSTGIFTHTHLAVSRGLQRMVPKSLLIPEVKGGMARLVRDDRGGQKTISVFGTLKHMGTAAEDHTGEDWDWDCVMLSRQYGPKTSEQCFQQFVQSMPRKKNEGSTESKRRS